jgi:hypothetical protein
MDNEIGRSQCAIDTNGHCFTGDNMMLYTLLFLGVVWLIGWLWGEDAACGFITIALFWLPMIFAPIAIIMALVT